MKTTSRVFQERRFKLLSLSSRLLIDVLNWWRDPPHFLALPITDALPEDCEVVSVSADFERSCLTAIIYSESFEPVPDGDAPPKISGLLTEFRTIAIQST